MKNVEIDVAAFLVSKIHRNVNWNHLLKKLPVSNMPTWSQCCQISKSFTAKFHKKISQK